MLWVEIARTLCVSNKRDGVTSSAWSQFAASECDAYVPRGLEFGWLEAEEAGKWEAKTKGAYKQKHGGKLPAIVEG
jgi:hypothetical protein